MLNNEAQRKEHDNYMRDLSHMRFLSDSMAIHPARCQEWIDISLNAIQRDLKANPNRPYAALLKALHLQLANVKDIKDLQRQADHLMDFGEKYVARMGLALQAAIKREQSSQKVKARQQYSGCSCTSKQRCNLCDVVCPCTPKQRCDLCDPGWA